VSNFSHVPDGIFRTMLPYSNRTLTGVRSYREKASRTFLETLQIGFILGNPRRNLLGRKLTRCWKLRTIATQARGKEQEEFLFLFGRQ
jgi:hypothetical protein